MERLTVRNSEGIGVLKQPYQCERCGELQWSLPDLGNGSPTDRLAEYEDLGLTPEQLIEVDRLYAEKCKELTELQRSYLSGLELAKIWAELEKLKEYRNLEEQGLILRVPQIKKGKTLYWIWGDEIVPVLFRRITSCVVDNNGNPHVMCEMATKKDRTFVHTYRRKIVAHTFKAGDKRYFYSEDIGKSVFLTKEEAETALKELEEVRENEID